MTRFLRAGTVLRLDLPLKTRTMHPPLNTAGSVHSAAVLQARDRTPKFVYILEAPQVEELAASASTQSTAVGESYNDA